VSLFIGRDFASADTPEATSTRKWQITPTSDVVNGGWRTADGEKRLSFVESSAYLRLLN
jgi:hypothetical protein